MFYSFMQQSTGERTSIEVGYGMVDAYNIQMQEMHPQGVWN